MPPLLNVTSSMAPTLSKTKGNLQETCSPYTPSKQELEDTICQSKPLFQNLKISRGRENVVCGAIEKVANQIGTTPRLQKRGIKARWSGSVNEAQEDLFRHRLLALRRDKGDGAGGAGENVSASVKSQLWHSLSNKK